MGLMDDLARVQHATTARGSSWDPSGRNADAWRIARGEKNPSVIVPLGDFFCLGHCITNRFCSLPFSASANQNNAFAIRVALNSYLHGYTNPASLRSGPKAGSLTPDMKKAKAAWRKRHQEDVT